MSAELGTDDATHYTNQPTPPPTTSLKQKLRPPYHELRNTPLAAARGTNFPARGNDFIPRRRARRVPGT
jgi:hypothetical protein